MKIISKYLYFLEITGEPRHALNVTDYEPIQVLADYIFKSEVTTHYSSIQRYLFNRTSRAENFKPGNLTHTYKFSPIQDQ